ncbi:MAG: hypothetical protein R6W48_09655 [Gaiellaceae bacterium]
MGEQSHAAAMRTAIRGDFERLERRRGVQELMRVQETTRTDAAVDEPPASLSAPERPRWRDRFRSRD